LLCLISIEPPPMTVAFQNMQRNSLVTILVMAALHLCPFGAPRHALASDIVIVKDTEIKPYRDAIEGFKSSCSCTAREFDLSNIDEVEKAIKERPDAVLAVGTRTFRKIKTIRNVPLIYTMVIPSEAVDAPGDNVSGVSMDMAPDTYLDSITGLFPDTRKIGVLFDPEHSGSFIQEAAARARARGMTLVAKIMRDPRRMPALLDELRHKIDVLWMLPDDTLMQPDTVDDLMLFSFENNVPIFSFSKKLVQRGAAAALRIDPFDMGVRAGELLRQGGNGPLRVYARSPKLVVNRKICAKLGVRMNDDLVRHADTVE